MPPAASTITIRETLEMLDGSKLELAEGIANDQYVFWLGSGISRDRMPDLRDLAKLILRALQGRIEQTNPNCRYRRALNAVVALSTPSEDEKAGIDFTQSPEHWPVFDTLASRLVNNYARMLNVTVEGEEADFLLWDILDAPNIYSDPNVEPDTEHLCLAALAVEGVASEMPSANWDPLVERAISTLVGNQPVLRVAIAPEQTRENRSRTNLYKFHGCAQAARDNADQFRSLLVARQNQINGWIANNPVMGNVLTQLILTKRTLMLGLSAQDSNIQGLFSAAEVQMPWRWPEHPPAYVFAENALGGDQESLLQNVYHGYYTPENRPEMETEALVQAYAKPLLLSVLLFVLTAKLKMLIGYSNAGIAADDTQKLHDGLLHARNLISENLVPTPAVVLELLRIFGRTMTMFRDGTLPEEMSGIYSPITTEPLDRMPADPNLHSNGIGQFAIAAGLIGLGHERGWWTATKPNLSSMSSGSLVLIGRSGPAKVYFVVNSQVAIRLRTNGLVADYDDSVIIHSHESPPAMPRSPRRPPGRTGLATIREVSIVELLSDGSEVEGLLERFRSKVAL